MSDPLYYALCSLLEWTTAVLSYYMPSHIIVTVTETMQGGRGVRDRENREDD